MTTVGADLAAATAPLVVARDGAECVLGRPDLGLFVTVPEPGAVFVEALQSGASLAEATDAATAAAGEPVDGADFVATLTAAGLLDPVATQPDADPGGEASPIRGRRQRPIRWIEGVDPAVARRFFGRPAWIGYGSAAAIAVVLLVARPELRPSFESVWFLSDPLLSLLALLPLSLLFNALHEMWHWLAGRALGIPAIFRFSYRGVYVVFETDLSQIVTVPRRRRYGPFLAGMAVDSTVLAVVLLVRLAYLRQLVELPPLLDRVLAALVLNQVISLVWQFGAVFLRSDLYAVLANALRCTNLYRVTWLTTKNRLWRLSDDDRAELAAASSRDRTVARWFGVVYLVGIGAMCWLFLTFNLPIVLSMLVYVGGNLVVPSAHSVPFWESAAVSLYFLVVYGTPGLLALRERRLRRKGLLL
ncbi:hypothetical protein AB0I55_19545 [Actinocatenispora sera]|uniref:hypothetical protein n=1 Tax=Actinocatenispora sera TaxID=390989 RepID=UPI0033CD3E13